MSGQGSVWTNMMRLADWGLIFAPPTTQEVFEEQTATSDFLTQFISWEAYEKEIASNFARLLLPLAGAGLNVYQNASLDDLDSSLRRHAGVAIFSHCCNGSSLELLGRTVQQSDWVQMVPRNKVGILDLSVCALRNRTVMTVKQRAPDLGIAKFSVNIDARSMINYLAYFFVQFAKTPNSFANADLTTKKYFSL